MDYERKRFTVVPPAEAPPRADGSVAFQPKGAGEQPYIFSPRVMLAVNVALVTQRPLLVSGEPGSGKSSLARAVAAVLGWRYYQRTVTSRTQASDLMWTFDALGRLSDANIPGKQLPPPQFYVEPGPLWWAFDPATAAQRGKKLLPDSTPATDPVAFGVQRSEAVVLIDELDKADPDVPNDLLEPFDRKTFTVRETGDDISVTRDVLLVLTTNRERAMPRAFLRRCVTLDLEKPTAGWLEDIALARYGVGQKALFAEVAEEVMALRDEALKVGIREPSTAEYLDAVIAARELEPARPGLAWQDIKRALLWKSDARFPAPQAIEDPKK